VLVRSLLALTLVLVAALSGCDSGSDEAPGRRGSAAVVEQLQRGGYVLAFRHAATDPSGIDTTGDPRDCSRQRNLDAGGRRQSREIGRAFRELGIPVGRVLASPFCRTRDTARLAFGRVRASGALLAPDFFSDRAAGKRQSSRLRRLLRRRPRAGTNTVLVSHAAAIGEATGVDLAEGEAAVVRPAEGRRGFEVVERVKAGEWAAAE
jgi:phosphohistidine phosphatase SixA